MNPDSSIKRVGMIMDTSFPPDARVESEARVLVEAGYQVSLFCIDYGGLETFRKTTSPRKDPSVSESDQTDTVNRGGKAEKASLANPL